MNLAGRITALERMAAGGPSPAEAALIAEAEAAVIAELAPYMDLATDDEVAALGQLLPVMDRHAAAAAAVDRIAGALVQRRMAAEGRP